MRKVCFIDYDMSVRGGVEQVTASLANTLVTYYDIYIVSLCLNNELAYNLDKRIKFIWLLRQEKHLREMQKELCPELVKILNDKSIDVAIIQGNYSGFISAFARLKTKTKLIFCDHGALMNQWGQKDIVFIRLISSLLSHRVVTLTEQSREAYIKRFHLSNKKVKCIYNWIDLQVPRSEKYDRDSKQIISAGRFGKEKGFDMLIEVFASIVSKHPDWSLDLYGDGEMMESVRCLIAKFGIENNVKLMGMCPNLLEQYKNYAIYVLPSYREGMPLVLLEAKANRLPIVSFDIMTGPKEIVRNGIDGYLIEPYNLEKMCNSICELIENAHLRQEMSNRSQENLDKFSKQSIVKQWRELIDSL